MSPKPPVLRGYRYVRELAPGGYSMVYLYQQERPEREVAVKVLKDLGPTMVSQLVDEANAMAKLGNHSNIVQVFDTGVADDGQHYIVMPYCSGDNLATIARAGALDVRKLLRVGVQVAGAVHAAHRAKLVHRDIKPANILTDEYGTPRLTDFGIVGRLAPGEQAEDFGLSLPWSPPEILAGGPGSVESDVYSLGATLWHLLVGRSPFDIPGKNSRTELESRIERMPAPATGRADVPQALEVLLAGALAKKPGQRPASAQAVARELERIELDLGGPVSPDWPWHSETTPSPAPVRDPDLDGTADRPQRTPPPPVVKAVAPQPVAEALPEPTRRRPQPVAVAVQAEPEEGRRGRIGWWVWGSAVAVVALAAAAVVLSLSATPGGTRPSHAATVDAGAGNQDAGVLGEDAPPGTPTVTATRLDTTKLRFTWTYSAQLASDTFSWRTPDGKQSGIAKSASVDLPDPAGTELCLQVKVIRADGSHASVDWSAQGCGR